MQDLLARIRILDPDLRFDDGDAPADAMAAFEQVRARDRLQKLPRLTVPRAAVIVGCCSRRSRSERDRSISSASSPPQKPLR